jgi:hypothetical protein
MLSDTLQGTPPAVGATTLGTGVDSNRVLQGMEDEIVNSIVASILARTFPVTIVSHEGNNVVLSQGGNSVKAGARYAVVAMLTLGWLG